MRNHKWKIYSMILDASLTCSMLTGSVRCVLYSCSGYSDYSCAREVMSQNDWSIWTCIRVFFSSVGVRAPRHGFYRYSACFFFLPVFFVFLFGLVGLSQSILLSHSAWCGLIALKSQSSPLLRSDKEWSRFDAFIHHITNHLDRGLLFLRGGYIYGD